MHNSLKVIHDVLTVVLRHTLMEFQMRRQIMSVIFMISAAGVVGASDNGCPQSTPSPTISDASFVLPPGLQYVFIVFLLCMSALFSGLTLGLLSLDLNGLKVIPCLQIRALQFIITCNRLLLDLEVQTKQSGLLRSCLFVQTAVFYSAPSFLVRV